MSQRTWAVVENLDTVDKTEYKDFVTPIQCPEERANLVCSRVASDAWGGSSQHMPCIDIDLPIRAVESRTPGHFHLYIDKAISWPHYARILTALADAGIVEQGYLDASLMHGATFVRKPPVAA